jgi:putative transposase
MYSTQALRLRLDPTPGQVEMIERIAGACRAVANIAIDQRRWARHDRQRVTYATQAAELASLKEEFPWVAAAPHHCLQQSLVDVETAYKNFWEGRAGAPKHRKRKDGDSFRFPDPLQFALEGDLATPDKQRRRANKAAYLKLPKLGRVRCVLHRAVPLDTRLRSVTIVRDGRHWMASVLIERGVATPALRDADPMVGIDLGVAQPAVLSTGQKLDLPKVTRGDLEHEARLHRRVSGKPQGSANRRKAVQRLAVFKARQANRRRDAMEKATTAIAKSHGVVAMEALNIRGMTASAAGTAEEPGRNVAAKSGLNRSILDVSPGAFRIRLGQKLAATGGTLLLVPAAHTSQRCNRCGHVHADNRRDRDRFVCMACGHAEDADLNAARNIRDRAKGVWGDASAVTVEASLSLLLAQQAKPKRSFKRKTNAAGGRPASACQNLVHVRGLAQREQRAHQQKAGNGVRRRAQEAGAACPRSPVL